METTGQTKVLDRSSIVTSLHDILKPFLLRRLKEDVEPDLPLKKEYVLYAPLTQQQKDLYEAVANRGIREFLINKKQGLDEASTASTSATATPEPESDPNEPRSSRRLKKKPRPSYNIEESDRKFMNDIENGRVQQPAPVEDTVEEVGRSWALKSASACRRTDLPQIARAHPLPPLNPAKQVNNMKLQNMVMQLRKVCGRHLFVNRSANLIPFSRAQVSNHPFLFDWPVDPNTGNLVVNEDLVNASGKVLLLQRLLDALLERGHKVLIFSQFTTMLDVLVSLPSMRGLLCG
jgi:ATP-dependent DNA helicase